MRAYGAMSLRLPILPMPTESQCAKFNAREIICYMTHVHKKYMETALIMVMYMYVHAYKWVGRVPIGQKSFRTYMYDP